ncbi:MAG: AAA family ATPase, partial [Oscillibacter sp.]|nr:AAA family ATPase [Oscillibacter sp.]
MNNYAQRAAEVVRQVGGVLFGKEREIREVLLAILANGHILLEDIPGVGKTTLAMAFSKTLDLDYRRVQFTPDVLPSDLTGFSIYRREQEAFVYQPGIVFC